MEIRLLTIVWILFLPYLETKAVIDVKCPRGWEPIGCDYKWQCVIPMSEFETEKACIKKGGIPSAVACLKRGKEGRVRQSTNTYCIKDLMTGEIDFARNLRLAIAAQERRDKAAAAKDSGSR